MGLAAPPPAQPALPPPAGADLVEDLRRRGFALLRLAPPQRTVRRPQT
jgi:hypothetical protein